MNRNKVTGNKTNRKKIIDFIKYKKNNAIMHKKKSSDKGNMTYGDMIFFALFLITIILILNFAFKRFTSFGGPSEEITEHTLIVDVRTPDEFASGHYPGAINIPVDEILYRLDEFGDKDGHILVYCRSGNRSSQAKSILEANGFTNVTDGGGLSDMGIG